MTDPSRAEPGFLEGGGEMAAYLREADWSRSPIGQPSEWPPTLKSALSAALSSRFPMVVWWGPELLMFYNDAWVPILGRTKHPQGFGRPGKESWPETWPIVGAQFESALKGVASWSEDLMLASDRRGFLEECYFTYSHSPLRDEHGEVVGVFSAVSETTAHVLMERRLRLIQRLSDLFPAADISSQDKGAACSMLVSELCREGLDIPFAVLYRRVGDDAELVCRSGLGAAHPEIPEHLALHTVADPWGVVRSFQDRVAVECAEVSGVLGDLPGGAWPEPVKELMALPFEAAGFDHVLVCGVSPRLRLDERYRDFLKLVSRQFALNLTNSHLQEAADAEREVLSRLNDFSRKLVAAPDLDSVLRLGLDTIIELHGADFGNLQLYDRKTRTLRLAVHKGFDEPFLAYFAEVDAAHGSVCGQALRTGARVVVEDVEADPEFAPHRHIARGSGFRAVQSTPLISMETGRPVGMVSTHFREKIRLTRRELELTDIISRQLADVIVMYIAEERLRESEAKLQEANESLEGKVGERTRDLAAANRQLKLQIERRTKAEESLTQMQRLEAVGELTAGVAHDFNNLLMVVLGNVRFMENRLDDPAQKHRLMMAREAAERGARLTTQLLAFSRRQTLEPRPVDLNDTVKAMGDLLQSTLGGLIQVHLDMAQDLWPASVDADQLELLFLNLAINARDAMASGGELWIKTENVRIRRRSDAPGAPEPGEYVAISIRDTGHGMSPQVLARVFEPFFTTKAVGKGSGLGLAQVYGFSTQSGGGVKIESAIGEGTTVQVFLPRLLRESGAPPPEAAQTRSKVERRGVVLVVDDDAAVRETESTMIADLGYEILEAASGAAALELVEARPDIGAVMLDFAMPGMNGGDAAREIARLRPGLPVVLVTGYGDLERIGEIPGGRILKKPFDMDELAAKLQLVA
jgi:signal transduction histidine kinase